MAGSNPLWVPLFPSEHEPVPHCLAIPVHGHRGDGIKTPTTTWCEPKRARDLEVNRGRATFEWGTSRWPSRSSGHLHLHLPLGVDAFSAGPYRRKHGGWHGSRRCSRPLPLSSREAAFRGRVAAPRSWRDVSFRRRLPRGSEGAAYSSSTWTASRSSAGSPARSISPPSERISSRERFSSGRVTIRTGRGLIPQLRPSR